MAKDFKELRIKMDIFFSKEVEALKVNKFQLVFLGKMEVLVINQSTLRKLRLRIVVFKAQSQ